MSGGSSLAIFTMFAQSLNGELAARDCGARIDEYAPERPGWMTLVDRDNRRIGLLPDDVSAEAICAFMEILAHRASANG